MDNQFFHYTTLKALYGIISKQELWLSNLKNSNDPNEVSLTYEQYNRIIECMGINPYHGTPMILSKNKVMGTPYGVSLTTLADNLSQWERYGDSLRGVSILFDIDFIQSYLYENYHFKFCFEKMRYTDEERKALILENISTMPKFENYIWKNHWPIVALFFIMHYSDARALFKSEDFIGEKEYRLFFDPIQSKFYHEMICMFNDDSTKRIVEEEVACFNYKKEVMHLMEQDKQYALLRNGITSFMKLDLNLFGDSKNKIIREIQLGPKCPQDEDELKSFLSCYGYSPIISKSSIRIRG